MQNNISLNNDILDNLKIKAINRTITIQDGPVYHDEYFDADLPSNPLFVMVKFGVGYQARRQNGKMSTHNSFLYIDNAMQKLIKTDSSPS